MEFDYIVIGSGAGGSVLAERLSLNPAVSVLVLEAGGSDRHPIHLVPKGFAFTMTNPKYTRRFDAGPFGPEGTVDAWFRGRVVGGSTTLNGLIWNRGWAPDYDRLEAEGNPGWGWDTFLDAFKRLEDYKPGSPDIRGTGGPVSVEMAAPPEEICEAFMDSGATIGMQRVEDVNGSDLRRTGYTQFSTKNRTRVSAARAFLRPALRRKNLTLLTGAEVDRIEFDGTRAVGVIVRRAGSLGRFKARREVLVCTGALESPLLLERSGIGRGDVLAAAGITQVVESPHVGERLSEHRGIRFMYEATGAEGFNLEVNTQARQLMAGTKYMVNRSGFIGQGSASVLTYFTAVEADDRPDTIGFFSPASTKSATLHNKKLATADEPGMMVAIYPLRPTSQGSIHVRGPSLDSAPRIDPKFLDTDYDKSVILGISRRTRELFSSAPISRYVNRPLSPACTLDDDEEILNHVMSAGASGYHTLGSCAMGPNDDDVVDSSLRVRGVEGLRVVDASVFPHQPSGNTSAPTQALAWHAASLIES